MKHFLVLIILIWKVVFGFSQQLDLCPVVVRVIDTHKKPLKEAQVWIKEPSVGTPDPTDQNGECTFRYGKNVTVNCYVTKEGYISSEYVSKRIVCNEYEDFIIITLEKVNEPPQPTPEICNKKFIIYPITGSPFGYKKNDFYKENKNKINWWFSVIGFGSSLAFSGLQLHYSNQKDKYFQEALKYQNPSTQYTDNFNLYKEFSEKEQRNLFFLIPSVTLFVTFKTCFHCKRRKYCSKPNLNF